MTIHFAVLRNTYSAEVTAPPIWGYGRVVLGCGTFGGIGGSQRLVGRGLDEPSAFATMDEAVGLGMTLFDTAERYGDGASETIIGRWLVERDLAITERVRLATKVAPPGEVAASTPPSSKASSRAALND